MNIIDRINLSFYNLINMLIYGIFNLFVVKNLSFEIYGEYSYYLSLITFFSTFPLLSLPLYIQRQVCYKERLDKKYFFSSSVVIFFSVPFIIFFLRGSSIETISIILSIIVQNLFVSVYVNYCNGIQKYKHPYYFQVCASIWMLIFCFLSFFGIKIQNLDFILLLWSFNFTITFFIFRKAFVEFIYYIYLQICDTNVKYLKVLNWMILILLASLPYDFMRFFERYLVKNFCGTYILGLYSFYLMAFGFFSAISIRSILGGLLTSFLKEREDVVKEKQKIIKEGVCYFFLSFVFLILLYMLKFLNIEFLKIYLSNFHFAVYVFCNSIFIYWAYLIMMVVNIKSSHSLRLIYFVSAMAIYLMPTLVFKWSSNPYVGLLGITVAYMLHFLLALGVYYFSKFHRYRSLSSSLVIASDLR